MEIVPATPATWEALADLFARRGGGDARFCWCAWWRVRAKDFGTPAANRELMRGLVATGPPPGLVALEDGRAVGWVGLGPRPDFERLERSRVIPRVEGPTPWTIVCFVVAAESRGRGVATALLRAAVKHAQAAGAPAVEGYPVDPSAAPGGRVSDTGAFVGTRSMFECAGFDLAAPTASRSSGAPRVVMRLELP
jgi:GNAT superfamily N-acetyltransferase